MKLLDLAISQGDDELAALCLLVGAAHALNGDSDDAQTEATPRRATRQPQRRDTRLLLEGHDRSPGPRAGRGS